MPLSRTLNLWSMNDQGRVLKREHSCIMNEPFAGLCAMVLMDGPALFEKLNIGV
jgi:hypothetical protein